MLSSFNRKSLSEAGNVFLVHQTGVFLPAGDSDEVRVSQLSDVPFPRLSEVPIFF